MPLPRRTAVRLLVGLLVVAVIVGGVCWNSTRLNETERKLVGVWAESQSLVGAILQRPQWGVIFLADRRQFAIQKYTDSDGTRRWGVMKGRSRWSATPDKILERVLPLTDTGFSFADWYDPLLREYKLSNHTADGFTWQSKVVERRMRRITDPEALRLVERLEAGESP